MDDQLEFVKQIASQLDSAGIKYMVTGSVAMSIYSVPRMTRDVDLVIEVTLSDVDRIVELFADSCYIDNASVQQAVREQEQFNIIHSDWVVKADFIVRKNDDYRREEFTRRRKIDVEGTALSVVAPEDLILSKLVWAKQSGSDLQLRDVRGLIAAGPKLDWAYLDKWADVLGVADLLSRGDQHE